MTPKHHRRLAFAGAAIAASVALAAPSVAFALFSSTPPSRQAGVTAATIATPTTFTATATGQSTASLSWAAPPALTGYTLSQSPGTLAGCSATPASGATSCTATGLLAGTTYTWRLHAVYDNWTSSQVQADATTDPFATDIGNGTATCSDAVCTGPDATTVSGRGELIFVYVSAVSGGTISAVSGPFTGVTQVTSVPYPTDESSSFLYVFKAAGDGTGPTPVTVSFVALGTATVWMDTVQLAAGESVLNCSSCTGRGLAGPATAALTVQTSTDKEIVFLGSENGGNFVTPDGLKVLAGGGTADRGTYTNAVVQAITSFTMSPAGNWANISLEVSP
jgi:hypothetical protein